MKKVLLMYATYGTGHKAIAKYVEDYFKSQNEELKIKNIDLLDYVMPMMGKTADISNKIILSGNPILWGMIYKFFDSKITTFGTYRLVSKFFDSEKLKREVVDFNPDLVISTHFFASTSISRYKKKGYIDAKLITIIPDYQSHELWLQNNKTEDAIIVASKDEKKEIVSKGVEPSKIRIYGIPISSKFSGKFNHEKILKDLSLSGKRPIYLFFGGGGVGSKTSLPYLKELIKLNLNADIIFVSGHNTEVKRKAQKIVQEYDADNVRVFGFVTNVPELTSISEAVITKPGGITVTECLTLKKPMILINKTAGHEKGNFKYLTRNGYALNGSSLRKFKKSMTSIYSNKKTLEKLKNNLSKNKDASRAMEKLYNLSMELLNNKK